MRLVLGGMNQGQLKVALELTKLTEDRVTYCRDCSFEDKADVGRKKGPLRLH